LKHGQRLFEKVCSLDLEGIVAKRKASLYRATEKPSPYWIKIKNSKYTQAQGRAELVEQV
jgi:ATP-dependent DNA ligase